MEYGVGITNRYAFLEDDVEGDTTADVEEERPPTAEKKADKKKSDKTKSTQAQGQKLKKKDAPEIQSKPKGVPHEAPSRDGSRGGASRDAGRGGRGAGATRGGRSADLERDKENRGRGGYGGKNFNDADEDPLYEAHESRDVSGRGHGGSRGGGRGGFTRRRDYDRVSGSEKSGVKPVDKRDGAGAHNWGTYKDEIEDDSEHRPDDVETAGNHEVVENGQGDANLSDGGIDNDGNGTGNEETGTVLVVEEERPLLTLDEWKAMQQPRSTPEFNIRKPNEGEDPTKWKNLVLKKKENLDADELEYEEGEDIWVPQRAGRLKTITDIGFHFQEREERTFRRGFKAPRGEGDERSNSGTGRGDGSVFVRPRGTGFGRGFRREYTDRASANFQRIPRVDDINDFPSLGVH